MWGPFQQSHPDTSPGGVPGHLPGLSSVGGPGQGQQVGRGVRAGNYCQLSINSRKWITAAWITFEAGVLGAS